MKFRIICFSAAGFLIVLSLSGQGPRAGQGKGSSKTAPAAEAAKPTLPPTTPAELAAVANCQALRKHGASGERACWEGLSRSNNPAIRAEGLWALQDHKGAFDAFNAAVDGRPMDANLKVHVESIQKCIIVR